MSRLRRRAFPMWENSACLPVPPRSVSSRLGGSRRVGLLEATRMTDAAVASASNDGLGHLDPTRVAERYEIHGLLGRGGMATAYRAVDGVTGKAIALKRLQLDASEKKHERMVELFEREFHTLVQLAHPRVVQAHDYGV